MTITTTSGELFTMCESVDLARLIFKRFGNDLSAATEAWRRLLQNDCPEESFSVLLSYPEHTEHCRGECRGEPGDYDNKTADATPR